MKKHMLFMFVALCLAGTVTSGWSQTDAKALDVSANISSLFQIVNLNPTSVNFGNSLNVGDESFVPLGFDVKTNKGSEWTIVMQADAPHLADNSASIPVGSFRYNVSGGAGVKVPAGGALGNVPATPSTIYTSDLSEYTTNPAVGIGLGLVLNIPLNQKSGAYVTTLNLSLVDAF